MWSLPLYKVVVYREFVTHYFAVFILINHYGEFKFVVSISYYKKIYVHFKDKINTQKWNFVIISAVESCPLKPVL